MKLYNWIKHRLLHKIEHFSLEKIKSFLKENGLAFTVIFIGWEITEDILFPIMFGFIGAYVNPIFYAAIPASLVLCFHWLAVPILWAIWVKISKRWKTYSGPNSRS